MRHSAALIVGLVSLSSAGCSGEDPAPFDPCAGKVPCSTAGLASCDGNVVVSCADNGDGCGPVESRTDCIATGQVCLVESPTVAACFDPCAGKVSCSTAGVTTCAGDVVVSCADNGDGCGLVESRTDCTATSQICVAGSPTAAACVDPCPGKVRCATAGAMSCDGDVVVSCADNGDGCGLVESRTDCTATSQVCVAESPTVAACMDPYCNEAVADGSFEGGTPNAAWGESSTQNVTPLYRNSVFGQKARTGIWWAWFGGVVDLEVGTLSQGVTLPAGQPATLSFYLKISSASGLASDTLVVTVDGTQVFSVTATAADAASYPVWTLVTVDLTSFADGNAHTLLFTSTTNDTANVTSFMVDDVSIKVGRGC